MPGSSVTTYIDYSGAEEKRIRWLWTASAGGSVTAVATTKKMLGGILHRVDIVPSSATPPAALYDVQLLDVNAVDTLSGSGLDLPAASTRSLQPEVAFFGTLRLSITNAGNAKNGNVYAYWR